VRKKMGTKKTFGPVAPDSISYFFSGNKTDMTIHRIPTKKKDKPGSMPCGIGIAINRIKLS